MDRLCILPVLADRLSRVLAVPDDLIEEDDAWFADIFAQAIVDLSVEGEDEEYLVGVEQVVERGMFTEYSSVPYWPENLALTRDEVIVGLSSREGHRYPPDPMDLASWAAFKEPGPTPLNLEDIRRTANAEEKSKAKAKRKAARKARKKSRSKGR